MAYKAECDVPMRVIDPTDDADRSLRIEFAWTPGQESTGMSGPPENYDPGSGDEFEIERASYVLKNDSLVPCGLAEHEEEAVINWLDEHWPRPPAEPDDPDWARDEKEDYDGE